MKKNNNSLLITVICGAVFCFVLMAIVFLLPGKNNNLRSNTKTIGNEINLGDTSCNISGPITVYGYDNEYQTVSDCSTQNFSGNCYELNGSADTSYCGSDDGLDCYSYKKYVVSCSTTVKTCGAGYYVSGNDCKQCPAGTAKSGTSTATSCDSCTGNTYTSNEGAHYCVNIPLNSTVNLAHTAFSCNSGYYQDGLSCTKCPEGKYCTGGSSEPRTCNTGWTVKEDQTGCMCAVGYGRDANNDCSICPVGTHKSTAGDSACDKCDAGTYQDEEGKAYCKEPPAGCYQDETGQSSYKECSGTVNESKTTCTNPVATSYTITFAYADGLGRVTYTCKTDGDGYIDSSSCVYGSHAWCGSYSIYPCNGLDCVDGVGKNLQGSKSKSYWFKQKYTANTTVYCTAGTSGGAVAACYKDSDNNYHWTAYPNSSWTKLDLAKDDCKDEEIKIPYCYIDDDNNYYWTSDPAANWKKVDGITKEANCKETEDEACYIDANGGYTWGKHAKDSGYTLVTSIKDSASCKAPVEGEACYVKDNDYIWATTAPEGYTKVETIKTPEKCIPDEVPACYLYGNSFVWGKYANVTGYIMIENITDEASCKTPESDACYVDKNGNYVWGKYANDSKYTLVSSVSDMSQCKGDVPVPATGISTSKLVYVFMVILMAFGIGFIYYSSAVKKNN